MGVSSNLQAWLYRILIEEGIQEETSSYLDVNNMGLKEWKDELAAMER